MSENEETVERVALAILRADGVADALTDDVLIDLFDYDRQMEREYPGRINTGNMTLDAMRRARAAIAAMPERGGWRPPSDEDIEAAKAELLSFWVERREVIVDGREDGVWNVLSYNGTICGGDYPSKHAAGEAMRSLQARAVITAYLHRQPLPSPHHD